MLTVSFEIAGVAANQSEKADTCVRSLAQNKDNYFPFFC